jgi:hypothetical protein
MTSEDLSDLKRYFGIVAEQLGDQVRLVAEGVTALSDRLDRVSGELGEQIHRESEDTRAVFRLSHVEVERRFAALETVVADLTLRIQRIETRVAD